MEPVVAHPAIHHRVHRDRDLQRRMRVKQRHERRKSVVRDADDPHLAVRLRHMLHQPVDRVVRVGRMVHRRRIQRPVQRPIHHIIALAAILAAHVLHHADIPAVDNYVHGVVISIQRRIQVCAMQIVGQSCRAIRRAGQQNAGVLRAFRNQDDRMQLHAVAHRDHHIARRVVIAGVGRLQFLRSLARQRRRLSKCTQRKQQTAHGCAHPKQACCLHPETVPLTGLEANRPRQWGSS